MMPLHVAVGVIADAQGQILIARRPPGTHLAGLWEFPGGKLEAGETVQQALARELDEELGVRVQSLRPLIKLRHVYPEREVLLDVWRVTAFDGMAHGRENQPLAWVAPGDLQQYAFPAGNLPIISAVRLPDCYAVLDVRPEDGASAALRRLESLAEQGITLAQLRAKHLEEADYRRLARRLLRRAEALRVAVLLNAAPHLAEELGAAGVQLAARRLMALTQRPLPAALWLAASCHNAQELAQAERIGADFAVLSPVQPTATHPGAPALGWPRFAAWVESARIPVYALGGVGPADLAGAWRHGAQGIAAIRAFLPHPKPGVLNAVSTAPARCAPDARHS
ncbi:MAG: Nudix family hydrolase [Methylococcaceae bacterium]|nr:MAG: Nudix family hydrolase [Methylococcaceae bacterium]